MPTWQEGEQLQASLNMVVLPPEPSREGVITLNVEADRLKGVSSSLIRATIAQDGDFSHLVCEPIEKYICDRGLYRG